MTRYKKLLLWILSAVILFTIIFAWMVVYGIKHDNAGIALVGSVLLMTGIMTITIVISVISSYLSNYRNEYSNDIIELLDEVENDIWNYRGSRQMDAYRKRDKLKSILNKFNR